MGRAREERQLVPTRVDDPWWVPAAHVLPASYQQGRDGPSFCQANAAISVAAASSPASLSGGHGCCSTRAHLGEKLVPLSLGAADGKHLQEAGSLACNAFPTSISGLMRCAYSWLFFFPFC